MICDIYKMSVLWRESYRITLYIHLRLVQNWRFVWEGLQYRSPNLEQTFFTGMGKIDCRAGADGFFCLFFLPLRDQHAVSRACPGGAGYTWTTHAERTHAPAKWDTLFPSPLGKIDCRAGGDAFFCLFFFPLRVQLALDQMGCKDHASFQDYCC